MWTTNATINNCGLDGCGPSHRCVEYCFRALLPLPREELGNCSLEVNVCSCVAQWSSQRGLDCAVGSPFVPVPACTAGCVPPFALSLRLMFSLDVDVSNPHLCCCSPVSVPSGDALQVPPVSGSPASGLRALSALLLLLLKG